MDCDPEVLGTSPSSQRSAGSVSVPNGVVTYSGVVLGSVATLACDTGYSVSNEYNRTCKGDGHWSQGTLRCEQETIAGKSTKRDRLCSGVARHSGRGFLKSKCGAQIFGVTPTSGGTPLYYGYAP